MEKTLKEKEKEVVESFSMYDEWLDKYEYLIDLGKSLGSYPEDRRTDDKLIKGCQSRVWLDYHVKDGMLFFNADSDAIITKGIISLLIGVYSGRTPEEIAGDDFSFIDKIGLKENLSPTRANGLVSMIEKIKTLAVEHLPKEGQGTSDENPAVTGESTFTDEAKKEVLTPEDMKELAPLYSNVVLALKQVYDPEIPVNIYDLGLIYDLYINKKREAYIKMTFTAPNCPMADEVIMNVKTSVEDVPGITLCVIDLVFEPAWDRSMLTDEAKVELGMEDF